ncbi:hypothetical protein OA2633_03446 [Oceanicaulis sp. HTCC2633]|uniref:MarR family transcriptional regulator n=1 Tax=Oceanicaulis sp. HTCC2633 TaxID=314254 RepID=UPI000066D5BD|nr:MarR family transcriptional regulator [Oceanicaulis sp. HTCC2633]EAP91197.1 hypothetical protein OA2633_03446 [Oceanicaulis sp. HTCC2633]
MSQFCAVLTGDLINSTKTDREIVERAFDALFKAGDAVRDFDSQGGTAIERYRGDGWQVLVRDPRFALRAALMFSAAVASVDRSIATRIAVGTGPLEGLNPAGLGASDGPAFRISGRLLEAMPRGAQIALKRTGLTVSEDSWRAVSFALAGAVAENWTQKQALVMRHILPLPAPTQTDIASRIGVTQQTVQQHFESAHGPLLLDLLEQVEAVEWL